MISTTQREVLGVLAELCDLSPDVRLGQLLAHLGFLGEDQTGRSLWDIDDEQLLAVLYHHRAELVARRQASPSLMPQPDAAPITISHGSTGSGAAPGAELSR
jgi:hypothetical protein